MLQSQNINASFFNKLKKIQLIIFDVDGILTDGRLYYGADGECMKVFHAKDGYGIRGAKAHGYQLAIITARESLFVQKRAEDLGIEHIFQNAKDKKPAFEKLCQDLKLDYEQVAYMGDDVLDLPVIDLVGFAACPADAWPTVKSHCDWVSCYKGGHGAAREFCDLIVQSKL